MKYIAYEFYPEMEIITDRKFTSFVVAVVPEMQPNGYDMNLIVYKDWNPYREYWDYHVKREIELSILMKIYKDEFEQEGGFISDWMDDETKQRIIDSCIPNQDGKNVTLDNEHLKEIFSKYKILKTFETND